MIIHWTYEWHTIGQITARLSAGQSTRTPESGYPGYHPISEAAALTVQRTAV